ncbi:uncharacterized protein PFL1_02304 [Pseudozyma flocculosa PF-1]|uniref:Related to TNA1 - high affinity nicotinic acid plasma membrane permease n=1 Tax=Pseudozyma flocculosa TaxID=84751 RepID=A0A5C3F752_9BASI|nr:uncharacterized protein PFL1_02304 [Pseudozyma flocculosa PF-1]EPQ30188.1 hypothetical protein PFL1_02304 [Pseudozyma flocculosa PF-1]SPO39886.1 related to TNA1 - high affinity nicotinic acid plasma membrane permease [Pseudozyma flocculosa]
MASPHAGSPDTASIEKRDEAKLEGGYGIAPVLTSGQLSMAHDVATTVADDHETKRIVRKMDWHVLPICSVLYLFSFLDRSAIGNARTLGMNAELKLTASQYAAALSIFFLLYGLLEVPSNICLKRYGAKLWLPAIVICWGIIMLCTGFASGFVSLFVLRLLLGGFEAGLFPGVSYLLTVLYPRKNIQLRVGIFFSAATIAGAFGGALAAGFAKVTTSQLQGWSFIFIFEGLLTILVGVVAYFVLFDDVSKAKFLSTNEKVYYEERIRFDGSDIPMNDEFRWSFVKAAFTDWKTLFSLVTYVSTIVPLYSIALTLPAILKTTLKYPAIESNLLTVPVYTFAAMIVILFAFLSDKYQNRAFFVILGNIMSVIGWTISHIYLVKSPWVAYGGLFIGAAGAYGGFPGVIAALTQNLGGKTKRSVSIAINVGVGGFGGLVSSNIFFPHESPQYPTGHYINIGLASLGAVSALCNVGLIYLANQAKQRKIDSGEAARLTKDEISDMGDESPYFKYRY